MRFVKLTVMKFACVKQFQFLHPCTIWGIWSDQRIFVINFFLGVGGEEGGSVSPEIIRSVWLIFRQALGTFTLF